MKTGNNLVSFCVTCICLLARCGVVQSITTSVVLLQEPDVYVNELVTYTCVASGRITTSNDRDPTFVWTIRNTDQAGTVERNLTGQAAGTDTDPFDGVARSEVTFRMQERYDGKRIWCGAIDYQQTTPTVQIYGTITKSAERKVGLGSSCIISTIVCSTSFSSCVSGICQCNNNYYDDDGPNVAGGNCLQQGTLGSTCNSTLVSSCRGTGVGCSTSTRTCICQSGYVQSGSTCIPDTSAGLGESCSLPTRSCNVANSFCNTNLVQPVCQCNSNYYQSSTAICSLKSVIGNSCDPNFSDSCSTTGSTCNTNTRVCTCSTGYSYDASSNGCLVATLGQSCLTVPGCRAQNTLTGTTTTPQCTNNVCICPGNYFASSGDCTLKAGLNQACSDTSFQSCSDANAQCTGINPTCQCRSGYTQSGSVCVLDTVTLDYCTAGTQVAVTVRGVDNTPTSTGISTPDLKVEKTCYEVDIQGTITMPCTDVKTNKLPYQSGGWYRMPANTPVVPSTQGYINGAIDQPDLTISNAQVVNDGLYVCRMCYGASFSRCTTSAQIEVHVNGSDISSVTASVTPSTPKVGDTVTFTCGTVPANSATSYEWYRGSTLIATTATVSVVASTSDDGSYYCLARNNIRTLRSNNDISISVQYAPISNLPNGGTSRFYTANLATSSVDIECSMTGNPAITNFLFYNEQGILLQTGTSNVHTVTEASGYGRYSCKASNALGLSSGTLTLEVGLDVAPNTGASTEDSGLSVGVIAAIVLGIIFLLLLIIIIIICCCNYGWCRKKEKVEPQPVIIEQPKVKPYIPRSVVSAAGSTISRKDVGLTLNGHTDMSVSTDYEEPYTATPRYFLKAATTSGPIISMYDDQRQPRAYQLPSLDTQALYTDEQPRRKHKKRKHRKHRHHRDESPRKYHPEPEENGYAHVQPPEDDDLVVIPGPNAKQNYFE